MAFAVRTFSQIIRGMIGQMRATQASVTDYNVGSVARTMLEAPAVELDQLYQQMAAGLIEGIPTAIYRSFDFDRIPAVAASGLVRLVREATAPGAITVPVGFMVKSTGGVTYQTAQALTIPAGQSYGDVLVVATVLGATGNAAAGAICYLVSSGLPLASVSNPQVLDNGRAQETEGERKARFVDFLQSLARGTPAACLYIARSATVSTGGVISERVARVAPDEDYGYLGVYLHNGAGGTSAALVAAAQQLMDGYTDPSGAKVPGFRPAGMQALAIAMSETPVDVSLVMQAPAELRTAATLALIQAAVGAAIRAVPSPGNLKPLDLLNAALGVVGVTGGEIAAPTIIVPCPLSSVLVPGTVTVAWA